jgi:uncharacterized repeat protein (TIGR01451 family)
MRRFVLPISVLVVLAAGHIAASQVGSQPDPAADNNSTTVSVVPNTAADLAISLAIVTTTPSVGSTPQYVLKITNNGPASTSNVVARVSIPPGCDIVRPRE